MFHQAIRRAKQVLVLLVASASPLRRLLNDYHLALNDAGRADFHGKYARIYRRRLFEWLMRDPSAQWTARFMERDIFMPLVPGKMWLHWDLAVSITGHDLDVKQTYSELLLSNDIRPDLFFDVGANYGTHSILFRSVGIPVIAFEPNPTCFEFCAQVCALNDFSPPRWESTVVGSHAGEADLVFPERDTWLGSVSPDVTKVISSIGGTIHHRVRQRTLDDYYCEAVGRKLLIKIDVEGFELEVFRGAPHILQNIRPDIIFESNDRALRRQVYDLLASHGYRIYGLLGQRIEALLPMQQLEFENSASTNFLTRPHGVVGCGPSDTCGRPEAIGS